MTKRNRLSIEWINSEACDWPPMVKSLSVEIIRLRADLHVSTERMSQVNMLSKEKILLLNQVSEVHRKLGNAYRNLANELVVNQVTLITQGNKPEGEED